MKPATDSTVALRFRALQNAKRDVSGGLPREDRVVAIREYRHLRGGRSQVGVIVMGRPNNVEVLITLTADEFLAWKMQVQLLTQIRADAASR